MTACSCIKDGAQQGREMAADTLITPARCAGAEARGDSHEEEGKMSACEEAAPLFWREPTPPLRLLRRPFPYQHCDVVLVEEFPPPPSPAEPPQAFREAGGRSGGGGGGGSHQAVITEPEWA